jgi:hypothetical protein
MVYSGVHSPCVKLLKAPVPYKKKDNDVQNNTK